MVDIEKSQELKQKGNVAFQRQEFDVAVELFSKAIEANPEDHVLYSNRSGAYASLGEYRNALKDANKCVELKKDWAKGWSRKGLAELSLDMTLEAIQSYSKGLELDPENAACREGLEKAKAMPTNDIRNAQFELQVAMTLMKDPKIAKYIQEDKDYIRQVAGVAREVAFSQEVQKLQLAMSMCPDVRVKEGIAKLFGIDLPETRDSSASQSSKPEETTSKKEAQQQLTTDEKEAEEFKQKGNEAYKACKFEEAIDYYERAYEKNPNEILYLNNMAAVYLEQQQYEKCLQTCDRALEKRYEAKADFSKVAKVYNRKAACYLKMKDYEKAIAAYQKSLTEDNSRHTRAALREAERLWEKKKAEDYVDAEKAEEHRVQGNEYFKNHQYPQAKAEYDEAIKRNPGDAKLYSNRAAAYMQLFEYPSALKDAEKCIELDPKFAKGWARKGACHMKLKENHRAVSAYQEGLKIDPNSEECRNGLAQCLSLIRQTQTSSEVDEEQIKRAMADPEIQEIIRDPQFQLILSQLQSNPQRIVEFLKDPKIASGLEKLMAAGIFRMA